MPKLKPARLPPRWSRRRRVMLPGWVVNSCTSGAAQQAAVTSRPASAQTYPPPTAFAALAEESDQEGHEHERYAGDEEHQVTLHGYRGR
jgi:hypothetical protein